jgi:hypothetical protein
VDSADRMVTDPALRRRLAEAIVGDLSTLDG